MSRQVGACTRNGCERAFAEASPEGMEWEGDVLWGIICYVQLRYERSGGEQSM